MKAWKNNLDERQELTLLRLEHNGYWLAFWGLFAAMIVQLFLGWRFREIAGEWIVFMVQAGYLGAACIKNGIWDRYLRPTLKTNLLVSLLAALAAGVLKFGGILSRFPDTPMGAAVSGVIFGGMVFVCCFAALSLAGGLYRRRRAALEREEEP